MKSYLVACELGGGVIKAYEVEMRNSYIPKEDGMKKLKEKIVKKYKPRWHSACAAPDRCDGYVKTVEEGPVSPECLNIIALSRLDM